jgi:hypothetical protein
MNKDDESSRISMTLRLPAWLHSQLNWAATMSRRSMSAEILVRLENSLHDMPANVPSPHLAGMFQKLGELDAVLKEQAEYIEALEGFVEKSEDSSSPERPELLQWRESRTGRNAPLLSAGNVSSVRAAGDGEIVKFEKTIAISWLRKEDWSRWQAIDNQLPGYRSWLAKMENTMKELTRRGISFEKVNVDPDEFLKWCLLNKRAVIGDSRWEYAAAILAAKPR